VKHLISCLALVAIACPTVVIAQPYMGGGVKKTAGGGLPPFFASMKRHDITVRVSEQTADGLKPSGAGVTVGIRIMAGGTKVKDYSEKTRADGTALFEGVPSNPEVQRAISYQVSVVHENVIFPFDIDGIPTDEAEVQVAVGAVTTDISNVRASHAFIEMFPDEESLVVRHEMRLRNIGDTVINLGALPGGGLKLPCPDGAKRPGLHDEHDPLVEARGTDIIFKGALLPGGQEASFSMVYSIPYDQKSFAWSQAMPVPTSVGLIVAPKDRQKGHRQAFPLTLHVKNDALKSEESELAGGKRFQLIRGNGHELKAGEALRFSVTGLPVAPNWKIYALIAGVLVVMFIVLFGFRRRETEGGPVLSRTHLIAERDRLVRALARMRRAHERGKMSEVRFTKEQEAITARLVSLYRALDRMETAR
jgi:hypothetical protein